jgi:DNA repair exonuclease SbcCD ATPase subunit
MAKTVGEILEEQGVIKHNENEEKENKEEVEEKKISFLGEIRIKQLVMDLEKVKAEIEGLREIKFSSDERIKELAESTGELRSILFQKDSLTKELETKIKILEDSISDVDPKKISKQLQRQEEVVAEAEAKAEKVEGMYKDISKKFEESQRILESIKSVENLKEKVSQIENLVSKAIETKVEVDRYAGKTEKFYNEIEDRIRELPKLKSETEKLNDSTKEIAKAIDEINIKMPNFVKREEVDSVKSGIDDLVMSNKDDVEKRLKIIEDSLNISGENLDSRVEQMEKKKENIANLISNIEEQYKKGTIKKETFEEVKSKNEALINKINDDIKNIGIQKGPSIKELPGMMNELKENIKSLEDKIPKTQEHIESYKSLDDRICVSENSIEEIKNNLKQVSPEKMIRMANAIDIQTGIVNDILTKLEEVNRRLMDAKVNLSDYENRTRFFEVLNIVIRLKSMDEISLYLQELEKLVFKMKLDKLWNKEKQDLTEKLLMELSENWHELGRNDISKIFKDNLDKIKAPRYMNR